MKQYTELLKMMFLRTRAVVVWTVLGLFLGGGLFANEQDVIKELKLVEKRTKEAVQKTSPATVAVVSESGDAGSGVIVSKSGIILTAAHVVQNEDRVAVVFEDGKRAMGKVLGANFTRDAAMVQLMEQGEWPVVELGDSDAMKVGDFVMALGHAKGFDPTRRAPVRVGRLQTDGKQRFMISECTLIGGDSGGPLFDLEGRLIGIHSSIGPTLRLNNHVPVNVFKTDWERLVRGQKWGYLGLHPMADPDSAAFGCLFGQIPGVKGVVVADVVVGSPADVAGLQSGDVITSMSGRVLENWNDLVREMGRHRPGDEVDLVVYRRGEAYKTRLKLDRLGNYLHKMR